MTAHTSRGSTRTQATSFCTSSDNPSWTRLIISKPSVSHPTPVQGILHLYRIRDSSKRLKMKTDSQGKWEVLQHAVKLNLTVDLQ